MGGAVVYYLVTKDMTDEEVKEFKGELKKKTAEGHETTCEDAGRVAWHLHLLFKNASEFLSGAMTKGSEMASPLLSSRSVHSDSLPTMREMKQKDAYEMSHTFYTKHPAKEE